MADLDVAANLIKGFEGYISKAAWDVNHYRVGYGSDTEGAEQAEVTAFTTTTPERAAANLRERIPKFIAVVIRQISQETWNALNDNQRAALTSVAYNYGHLPNSLKVDALDPAATAKRLAALAGDNGGVNAKRRQAEAKLYLKPVVSTKPAIPPVVATGGAAGAAAGVGAWLYAWLTGGNASPALLAIGASVAVFGVLAYLIHRLPPAVAPTSPAAPLPTPSAPPAPAAVDGMAAMMAELVARKQKAAVAHQAALDADKAYTDQLAAIQSGIDSLSRGLHEIGAEAPLPAATEAEIDQMEKTNG